MAWLAVDKDGDEFIYEDKPFRFSRRTTAYWVPSPIHDRFIRLPQGSIKKLIGRDMGWEDEPVEI